MSDITQCNSVPKVSLSLNKTQFGLVTLAFLGNLVFIPSIYTHIMHGTWGGRSVMTQLPDFLVPLLGLSVHSHTLITWHAAAALSLATAMYAQFVLARRKMRWERALAVHRVLGPIILCTLLPAFLIVSLLLSLFAIHTPFNHVMFTVLPVMIIYAIVRAVVGLRSDDKILHADSVFLAFMLLESAPIFRMAMFVVMVLGGPVLAPNGEPVDEGALLRTIIVLTLLTIGYWSAGRLRRNLLPLALIGSVLALSLTMLPWSLVGAPNY